jgi:hypothetical protein
VGLFGVTLSSDFDKNNNANLHSVALCSRWHLERENRERESTDGVESEGELNIHKFSAGWGKSSILTIAAFDLFRMSAVIASCHSSTHRKHTKEITSRSN